VRIDAERDKIVFDDGTEMYANRGIIGISPGDTDVSYGYDGGLPELTPSQRRELSVYMIEVWRTFGGL